MDLLVCVNVLQAQPDAANNAFVILCSRFGNIIVILFFLRCINAFLQNADIAIFMCLIFAHIVMRVI